MSFISVELPEDLFDSNLYTCLPFTGFISESQCIERARFHQSALSKSASRYFFQKNHGIHGNVKVGDKASTSTPAYIDCLR